MNLYEIQESLLDCEQLKNQRSYVYANTLEDISRHPRYSEDDIEEIDILLRLLLICRGYKDEGTSDEVESNDGFADNTWKMIEKRAIKMYCKKHSQNFLLDTLVLA